MDPKYFEGVLQLRNPNQKIIDFVADYIEEKGAWIAKTTKQKNGVDLDLSSNKVLREIGKRLKNRFPGSLVESKSLFTQNRLTSKKVYRGCVLFKHFDVKKGDTIKFKGEDITVIKVGKDILGKNSENKKIHVRFEQLD